MDTVQSRGGNGFILLFLGGLLAFLFFFVLANPATIIDTTTQRVQPNVLTNEFDRQWDAVAVNEPVTPQEFYRTLSKSRAGEVIDDSCGIRIRLVPHPEDKHGEDAETARHCFDVHGTLMMFKGDGNRYARICMYDDGWVVVQFLAQVGERLYEEVSSYVPYLQDRSINGVRDWLFQCGFTKFNGPFP